MPSLSLDLLDAHPDNANRMSTEMRTKLVAHIRSTGEYPPIIVRHHPDRPDRFQILDGHHRVDVLRELGHVEAHCEIWNADDNRAALLLLTLNRLHGEDDPMKRGELLTRLNARMGMEELTRLLPDTAKQIRALMELTQPPLDLAPVPAIPEMPHAITFFLTGAQRARLTDKLDGISRDRSAALVELLSLNEPVAPERYAASGVCSS